MAKKKSRFYDEEFRANAVALSRLPGKTVAGVARELGISTGSLYQWRKRSADDETVTVSNEENVPEDVSAELASLRAQVRQQEQQLRVQGQEIEILSKATAWFANRNHGDSR